MQAHSIAGFPAIARKVAYLSDTGGQEWSVHGIIILVTHTGVPLSSGRMTIQPSYLTWVVVSKPPTPKYYSPDYSLTIPLNPTIRYHMNMCIHFPSYLTN